jgi:hypothetical protein
MLYVATHWEPFPLPGDRRRDVFKLVGPGYDPVYGGSTPPVAGSEWPSAAAGAADRRLRGIVEIVVVLE